MQDKHTENTKTEKDSGVKMEAEIEVMQPQAKKVKSKWILYIFRYYSRLNSVPQIYIDLEPQNVALFGNSLWEGT